MSKDRQHSVRSRQRKGNGVRHARRTSSKSRSARRRPAHELPDSPELNVPASDGPSEIAIHISAGIRHRQRETNDRRFSHILVALGVALIRHEQLFEGFAVMPRQLSLDLCEGMLAVFDADVANRVTIRLVLERELRGSS